MLGVSAKKVIFENFVSYEDLHGQRRYVSDACQCQTTDWLTHSHTVSEVVVSWLNWTLDRIGTSMRRLRLLLYATPTLTSLAVDSLARISELSVSSN